MIINFLPLYRLARTFRQADVLACKFMFLSNFLKFLERHPAVFGILPWNDGKLRSA